MLRYIIGGVALGAIGFGLKSILIIMIHAHHITTPKMSIVRTNMTI